MKNKKSKNIGTKIIFVLSCTVFIICVILVIKMYTSGSSNREEFSATTKVATVKTKQDASETTTLPDNPIDFKKLKKTNKDIYAWIDVPGTKVNYAVVQSSGKKDNLFYLEHNIYGNYEFSGSIFSQRQNSKNFSDPVTVLYGHNMKNGTMFNTLHKFENKDFFKKHSKVYIYTPKRILEYTIVSAYSFDNRHILNSYDFSKAKDLKSYIKTITNPSSKNKNVREDLTVTKNDNILTLSTCASTDSERYLVQSILTKITDTK